MDSVFVVAFLFWVNRVPVREGEGRGGDRGRGSQAGERRKDRHPGWADGLIARGQRSAGRDDNSRRGHADGHGAVDLGVRWHWTSGLNRAQEADVAGFPFAAVAPRSRPRISTRFPVKDNNRVRENIGTCQT